MDAPTNRVAAEAPNQRGTGDEGASLVEYALLLALIAVVCIGALTFLGGNLGDSFSKSGSRVEATGK